MVGEDGGSRHTTGTFSSLVSDFDYLVGKQKEMLSCHLQRLRMLLSTGTAAGSCLLWALTPGELAFALSERDQLTFLLPLRYETWRVLSLSKVSEERLFSGVGCSNSKQQDGSRPSAT